MSTKAIVRLLAAVLALGLATSARAQDYSARAITVIVPFAAGGPTDIVARIVRDHMSKTLGQQLVIENVVGAGGTTGVTRAMRGASDAYTIVMGPTARLRAPIALYP